MVSIRREYAYYRYLFWIGWLKVIAYLFISPQLVFASNLGALGNTNIDNLHLNYDFQQFDNQISFQYDYTAVNLYNPVKLSLQQNYNNQIVGLDMERLFNNKVWFDLSGMFLISSTENESGSSGFLNKIQALGSPASLTAKIGYGIMSNSKREVQLIPYITLGKVLNYNGITLPNVGFDNSYYYLLGAGARFEYIATPMVMLYLDNYIGYLSDQSKYTLNLSAWNINTVLGAKINLAENLQIGIHGIYNQIDVADSSVGYDPISFTYRNINQTTFGGGVSIGYVYGGLTDNTVINPFTRLPKYTQNSSFLLFDNWYSLGLGYASSRGYSLNNQPQQLVDSSLSYLGVNLQHLFRNRIWAEMEVQLINSISQSINQVKVNNNYIVPTYLTYPGSAIVSLGYAIPLIPDKLQMIPYVNGGLVMNINSLTAEQSGSLATQFSQDSYYQYGGGVRVEYILTKNLELYMSQLIAKLADNSGMNLSVLRSKTIGGANFQVYRPLQLGFSVFYDTLQALDTGGYNNVNGTYYNLSQNTIGGMLNLGLEY